MHNGKQSQNLISTITQKLRIAQINAPVQKLRSEQWEFFFLIYFLLFGEKNLGFFNTKITKSDYISKTKNCTKKIMNTVTPIITLCIFWDQHHFWKKKTPKTLKKYTWIFLAQKLMKVTISQKLRIAQKK